MPLVCRLRVVTGGVNLVGCAGALTMQSIIEILSSDVMILVHVAVTLCLLVFAVVTVIPLLGRQNALFRETAQLRDELRESDDRHRRAEQRLTDEQRRHRRLLSKIGDDIYEARPLEPGDFDTVRDIDAVSLTASRGVEHDFEHLPQIMLAEQPRLGDEPFRESVMDITAQHSELDGPLDDSINDESDPLTRALQISKAIRG